MSTAARPNPLLVPSPAAAALREQVREAAAARRALRIVGAGTWLDAGRPVRDDAERLDVGAHAGLVEYEPGDLTLTARAGTSLHDLQAIVGQERQWLALEPFGDERLTLGATVATASYGPLAHAYGTPRDNVLGVEFVTGAGDVVRGGGRVVKNVAGFDLARLVTGAWGTLGVITEVTVRLRAAPEVDDTVALAVPAGPGGVARLLARLRDAPIAPLALELVNDRLARTAGVAPHAVLLARLGGNAEHVRAQRTALGATGDVAEGQASDWTLLQRVERTAAGAAGVVLRLSHLPSRLASTWAAAAALADRLGGAHLHASVGRGVVRLLAAASDADVIRSAFAGLPRGDDAPTVVPERLPGALWDALAPTRVGDRLSRGVREAFDPHHILNPGLLGE